MYGAAYATLVAYVVEALVMYLLARQVFRLSYDLPRTLAAMGVFAVALAFTQIALDSRAAAAGDGTGCHRKPRAAYALGFNRINLLRSGGRTAL